MLTEVTLSGGRDVIKNGAEKILKYQDLTLGIQRVWNVTAKLIPVIIGATGTILKSLRRYLSNVPGENEIKRLQKIALLCNAHTRTAGSADIKVQNILNMGNNSTCSTDCKYRTAATLYVYRRYVVCLGV